MTGVVRTKKASSSPTRCCKRNCVKRAARLLPGRLLFEGFEMNPFSNDLRTNCGVLQLFTPAARAAAANGTGVDCLSYDGPLTAIAEFGTCTDGTYLFSLEESDDNSNYSAITPYAGSFSAVGTSSDETTQVVQFKRTKRYVRGVIAEPSGGTTGVVCSLIVIAFEKNS
jgi:hypothetical protein